MKLWEGLEQDLNYNTMVSQRGVLNLYHSDAQRDAFARRGNAMRLHGVDARTARSRPGAHARAVSRLRRRALSDPWRSAAAPRWHGAARRGRVGLCARRRPARRRHRAELRGHRHPHVQRPRHRRRYHARPCPRRQGRARGRRIELARSPPWRACGLPIESHVLQAFVTEGVKPLVDHVITFGAGHFYISQSDKGGLVFGGDIDGYNSYAQRGNLPIVEDVCEGGDGADADARARARPALVGRPDGHVDGRLADHRPYADRRPLSQRRLVLRRLQGDARVRLVLRAPDRARRAASGRRPRIGSIASPPVI